MFIKNTKLLLIVVLSAILGIAVAADRETINPLHALTKRVEVLEAYQRLNESRFVEVERSIMRDVSEIYVVGSSVVKPTSKIAILEEKVAQLEQSRARDLWRIASLERYIQEKKFKS